MVISNAQNKPFSNIYFENEFNYCNIEWTAIYFLPHVVMYNTYIRSFPCKILGNVLFLNKNLILLE